MKTKGTNTQGDLVTLYATPAGLMLPTLGWRGRLPFTYHQWRNGDLEREVCVSVSRSLTLDLARYAEFVRR